MTTHDLNETIDIRFRTPDLDPTPTLVKEQHMTPYQERREAGHYDAPAADTAVAEPEEDNGPTLKELQAEAEALDLPTYGTKAQLAERIANAGDIINEGDVL